MRIRITIAALSTLAIVGSLSGAASATPDPTPPGSSPQVTSPALAPSDAYSCGVVAPPGTSGKYFYCKSSGGIMGHRGYENTSSWYVPAWNSGKACTRFRGFTSKGTAYFYSGGCGTKGSRTYPWGNITARGQFGATNMTNIIGVNAVANF